jgi:hypothetical protein
VIPSRSNETIASLLLAVLPVAGSVALSAAATPLVAPLIKQDAIRGCSWQAWIPTPSSPRTAPFIFLADRDDSRAVMNVDGSDVFLKVEGKSGPLPKVGDVIERKYGAPGIEVKATYKVTSDCSDSPNESCEASGYSVTLEVKKDGGTRVVQAMGAVGC